MKAIDMNSETRPTIRHLQAEIPEFVVPAYHGRTYDDLVPHTFDLAERMALAVNGVSCCRQRRTMLFGGPPVSLLRRSA